MTSRPAATRCISYQTAGNSICRCGSLASIGRPLSVRGPATTQLLLSCRAARSGAATRGRGPIGASVPALPDGPVPRRRRSARPRLATDSWRRRHDRHFGTPEPEPPGPSVEHGRGIRRIAPASRCASPAPNSPATAARTSSAWWFSASRHASSRPTASESTGVHGAGVIRSIWNSSGRWRPIIAAATALTPAGVALERRAHRGTGPLPFGFGRRPEAKRQEPLVDRQRPLAKDLRQPARVARR